MSINIRRDNDDPFYRYKMPPIQAKVEGRGNGIKTAVINAAQVARALTRPPSYVIKYFGFELGAQTSISDENERYIVNGMHEASKLQDTLDGFINKFVLCSSCKNPETDLLITKSGDISKDCKACGVRSPVDPRHKLYTFIVKNPPSSQKTKRKGMANAAANTSNNQSAENGGSGDDAAAENGDDAAAENGQEEEDGYDDDALTKKINAEVADIKADNAEVEWSVDVSEEAVKARQKKMEQGMAVIDINDAKSDMSVFEQLGDYISKEDPTDVEIYKKAMELEIEDDHKTVAVLAQCLLDKDVVKDIDVHKGLFNKVITSEKHEQAMLGGIERLVGLQKPEWIKLVPKILETLYDLDLVSEEEILSWGTKVSKKYTDKETCKKVRKAAKPFVEWLQEADSDSE